MNHMKMWVKAVFGIMCLASIAAATGPPVIFQTPLSPRIANYAIDVRLDTANHSLTAQEVLTWHNRTGDVIPDLRFHLYLNAFRNNKSTLFEESGGMIRGLEINGSEDEGWGYIEILKIATPSGEDLTDRMEFIRPDSDDEADKTVMRLPLPHPIQPGDSIMLDIDFTARLPTPPMRSGYKGEYYFVGQWFPKVGVYSGGGWNCHQYHANSEFFADFGVYDVHITVPEENIVGACGLEAAVTNNGDGTATHYYHAEDIHDFAWTTSPDFVELTTDTQDVAIRLLIQPDHAGMAGRYLNSAKAAIAYFQDWIGDYPYPNLTIVDPRRGALNSGGMEYPTLITGLGLYGLPAGLRMIEGTIIHEFAHSFWYLMVATNEFEEPWLDEGFTTYSEGRAMNDLYGPGDFVDVLGLQLDQATVARVNYMSYPDRDPMTRFAWKYYSDFSYAVNAYFKPATMLVTLENYLGEDTMRAIIRAYYQRWRFKHPTTRDFIAIANEISGQDLNWFFDQAFYSNAVLDYSVSWISSKKVEPDKGYDFTKTCSLQDDSATTDDSVAVLPQVQQDASRTAEDTIDSNAEKKKDDEVEDYYCSRVDVRRLGTFVFPVDVEIAFDDGEKIRESWDGKDTWTEFRYIKPAKLVSATVDPDRKVTLDVNYTNNGRTLDSQGSGVAKMCVRALFWAQFMLEQPDFANLFSIFEGFSLE